MTLATCTISVGASAPRIEAPWTPVVALGVAAFVMVTTEFMPVGLLPAIDASLQQKRGRTGLMVTLPGYQSSPTAAAWDPRARQ